MKIRLGAFAIAALLAACSGQDNDTQSDGWQARSQSAAGPQNAGGDGLASLARDKARTLGNAPDKGELFTYADKKAAKQQGAYTLHPVRLSEEHAIRGVATGLMTVPAPDGSEIRIRYERHEEHPDGNWSWIGRVVGGDAAQEAIFTFGEEAVFGSIPQAVGPALRLTTKGGIAYLMQGDPSRLKKAYRAGGDAKVRAQSAAGSSDSDTALVAMAMAKASTLAKADVSTKAFTSANTIDLVVGYSNGFVTANGGIAVAGTRLNNLVTVANQALLNSKVDARIRVVAAVQVNYADTTDNELALEQVTGHDGVTPFTPPAALLPLRTARDQYGADLVTLIRDFQPQNNGCGIAWLQGANGSNIVAAADAPFGYSVVSDGNYDQSGNTYFCEDITLVHELAHNMGSQHDVGNAGGISGRYPYSYGYKTTAALGNFFTVMAYGDDNQTLYRTFSNPSITICGGRACGVANQADNARSLRQTIPLIAQFRNTVVPIQNASLTLPSTNIDVNGNGTSDVLWRNRSTGANVAWLSANSATVLAMTTVTSQDWLIVGGGDFDNDGKSDVLWRNQVTGANAIWKSANSNTQQTISAVPNLAWQIVGTGDFDGDGRSDIVWRNNSTGANQIWKSGNSATLQALPTLPDQGWQIAGIGDFDNDGKSDLLWRHAPDGRNAIWLSGNPATVMTALTVPDMQWRVAGIGDFDGDGRSDIFWRHSPDGRNVIWKSGNGATAQAVSTVGNLDWNLVAVGDYNGDNVADALWRNGANGQNEIWRSANSGTPQAITDIVNLAWIAAP